MHGRVGYFVEEEPEERGDADKTLGVYKKSVNPIRSDPIRSVDFDPIRRLMDW